MILLDLLISFAVAVLCGLGGGGGIFVTYLSVVVGIKQVTAQGVNLIFFLSSALGAFIINRKNKLIDPLTFAAISLSGIPFAVIGAYVAVLVKNAILTRMYGGLLVLSGVYYFFKRENG